MPTRVFSESTLFGIVEIDDVGAVTTNVDVDVDVDEGPLMISVCTCTSYDVRKTLNPY